MEEDTIKEGCMIIVMGLHGKNGRTTRDNTMGKTALLGMADKLITT